MMAGRRQGAKYNTSIVSCHSGTSAARLMICIRAMGLGALPGQECMFFQYLGMHVCKNAYSEMHVCKNAYSEMHILKCMFTRMHILKCIF